MKHAVLSALVMFFSLSAFSQQAATIVGYYDLAWQKVAKAKAAYYRTVEPTGDRYIVKDYYKSGKLQMQALCTAYEPTLIWTGNTKLYHENGTVSEEGMFVNEARVGLHTFWYQDGRKKKEMIYGQTNTGIVQFWSTSGEPLLIHGNGIVHDSDSPNAAYMDVEDSVVVASFDVRNGTDTVFTLVPQKPEYEGGPSAMQKDLRENLEYPRQARRMGIEGRVFVKFVIDKQGMMRDIEIVKGISHECDAESIRVVSQLNHWTPGQWRGKPVAVRFVLPINFSLGLK